MIPVLNIKTCMLCKGKEDFERADLFQLNCLTIWSASIVFRFKNNFEPHFNSYPITKSSELIYVKSQHIFAYL